MKRFIGIILFFLLLGNSGWAKDSLPLNNNIKHSTVNVKPKNTDYIIENIDTDSKTESAANITIKTKLKNNTKARESLENNDKIIDSNVLNITLQPNETVSKNGIIYQETQKKFDVIDPQKSDNINNYYPGLRGPNQLIIYTPVYGRRTGTNEFGTEAIVEDNMVTSLNGADSIIPRNGFVISGHGKAKKWIIENIQVGSKVYIDYSQNTIKVFLTPDSLLFAAKEKLKEVNELVEYYRKLDILYNDKKATEYLNTSKNYLRRAEKRPEKTQQYITSAMETLNSAIKNAIPYIDQELKGVWLRPTEKNQSEIQKTIEKLSNAGITDIFLETYFHGKTIYPSKYLEDCGVISQREEFIGFDPLEIWIKEAHKRKMKIHIWFETFYVGNEKPNSNPKHVLNVYPSWANKRLYNYNSEEPVPSLSEHNGYFLDPSNIQVQAYLTGILKEIITNYNPDGINLDYIRYPQTVDPIYPNYALMNWGYTENARDDFKSIYGIDPIKIRYGTTQWKNWSVYRQNQITKFVSKIKRLTEEKNILLTAVIFPDLDKCISTKMQNWRVWSMNDYIDGLTPLILTGDKNTADLLLNDVIRNTKPNTNIYPGIFVTFMGGSMDDLLLQIHKTREYKTKGAILFDYNHLTDKYIEALTTRVFNKEYEPRDTQIEAPQRIIIEDTRPTRKKSSGRKRNVYY